jgi:hypothetical protein
MFYGIDLHMDSFKAAILGDNTDELTVKTVSLKTEAFKKFLNNLSHEDYIVVEASTNTFWFVDQVKGNVKEVYVVDPYKFSIISNSQKKTDKIDAIKLAKKLKYFVRYDKSADEFPTIYIPSKEVSELRSMFVTYEIVKKQACMTKNRIRSLFRQNGIFSLSGKDLSCNHVQDKIRELPVSASLSAQLSILLSLLNSIENEKDKIKGEILKKGKIFYREIKIFNKH